MKLSWGKGGVECCIGTAELRRVKALLGAGKVTYGRCRAGQKAMW